MPLDPQTAAELNKLSSYIRHLETKIGATEQAYQLGIIETRAQQREALEKIDRALALNRELVEVVKSSMTNNGAVYAEQIPGKREPFWFTKAITIGAGVASPVGATEATSATGPFEVTQLMATAQIAIPYTVTNGAVVTEPHFRSINSGVTDPFASPNPAAAGMPGYSPDTTYNICFDFLWEYQTGKSQRRRMNAPVPSAFLFSEHGRPAYLACGDLLPPADSISYTISPLAPTRAWVGGVYPGPVAQTIPSVIVYFTMHGILYAQAPDYRP